MQITNDSIHSDAKAVTTRMYGEGAQFRDEHYALGFVSPSFPALFRKAAAVCLPLFVLC